MFGGIFTKLLLGLFLAALAGNGFQYLKHNWWDKPRYEKQIRELQDVAITLRAENFRQGAELKDREQTLKIHARHSHESQEVDRMVQDRDDTAMRGYFIEHGMLRDPKGTPAAPRAGRPQH
ncbi:MAG: hypothetical protein WB948_03155 [Desulfobaccales bacterium]|jgi:hypothetical protein